MKKIILALMVISAWLMANNVVDNKIKYICKNYEKKQVVIIKDLNSSIGEDGTKYNLDDFDICYILRTE